MAKRNYHWRVFDNFIYYFSLTLFLYIFCLNGLNSFINDTHVLCIFHYTQCKHSPVFFSRKMKNEKKKISSFSFAFHTSSTLYHHVITEKKENNIRTNKNILSQIDFIAVACQWFALQPAQKKLRFVMVRVQ